MNITKSNWVTEGDTVRLNMPIAKVDKENRLVSGFATLDNVDSHGDVVTAEASAKAFTRFRGNIREMHQPIAAGRLVDFKEDEFYHDGKFYRGVYVTAYVSKGAQDTWEKVLDGTLTGFSIGGEIVDSSNEWVKDAAGGGAQIRFIKDYDLVELSLVDNPANHLANVFSISKSADGEMLKGMVAETSVVNVFWCSEDQVSKNSAEENVECAFCGKGMENIGWFENGEDTTEKVRQIVTKHLSVDEQPPVTGEGGVNVTDENKNEDEVKVEELDETPVVEDDEKEADKTTDEATAPDADEAAAVDEVNTDEPDFEKMFSELHDAVKVSVEKAESATQEAVAKVEEGLATVTKSFETKTSELEKQYSELSEKLDGLRGSSDEVAKRLDALESETAVRKSADLESEGDSIEKSAGSKSNWKGAFLGLDGM